MRLAEAEQDIGKQPIPLTTLTLIEEHPDPPFSPQPPDPPDPPDLPGSANKKAEQLQQFTQKESKVLKPQDMWLIPELTPPDKNSKEPNTDLHTDNDFKANVRKKDQTVGNGKRKGIPVVTRKSLRQEESYPAETTTAPDNQYHIPFDELYGNKVGGFDQQFTGDEIPRGNDNDKRQRVSSSFHNQKEDSFQENPRLESPDEEKLNGKGTSGSPDINTAVHPTSIPSLDIKWHVAHAQTKRDEKRRYKLKRKKKLQESEESNDESLIVASGLIAGLIALLGTIMSIFKLR